MSQKPQNSNGRQPPRPQNLPRGVVSGRYQNNQQPITMPSRQPNTKSPHGVGVALTVLGIIGMVLSGFAIAGAIGNVLVDMFSPDSWMYMHSVQMLISSSVVFGGFGCVTAAGRTLRLRGLRLKRYKGIIGKRTYCKLEELVPAVSRPVSWVRRDIRKMIDKQYFGPAFMDSEQNSLILGQETYQHYLHAEEEQKRRAQAEHELMTRKTGNDTVDDLRKQGGKWLRELREANVAIQDERVSTKISKLEGISSQIFDYVAEHPQKLPDIRKFMDYYLPTTLKLLRAYDQFEEQPVQGENIRKARLDIDQALTTIHTAFANLLDQLFQDEALDVSADITVLATLMAQEGLTAGEFTMPINENADNEQNTRSQPSPQEYSIPSEKPEPVPMGNARQIQQDISSAVRHLDDEDPDAPIELKL